MPTQATGAERPAEDDHARRKRFAAWLGVQFDALGWTEKEFAVRADLPASSVSNWTHGHRLPKAAGQEKIARALGVTVDDVLEAMGHEPRGPQVSDALRAEAQELIRSVPLEAMPTLLIQLRALCNAQNRHTHDRLAARVASIRRDEKSRQGHESRNGENSNPHTGIDESLDLVRLRQPIGHVSIPERGTMDRGEAKVRIWFSFTASSLPSSAQPSPES